MIRTVFDRTRRAVRWLRYGIRRPDLVVIHHPEYARAGVGGLIDPDRADKVLAFLTGERLIRRADIVRPRPASLRHILRVHSPVYLESLADRDVVCEILGTELSPHDAQMSVELARLMAGGTIQATRVAMRTGKIVVHLGGGLHHATPDRGMGFCVFNDIAIAVRRLRVRHFDAPILVVDLDLHDGNGTRAVFARDETVYTFSIHNTAWDEAEAVASTSLALGSDVTDEQLLTVLRRELPPIVERHRPELIIYVAGVDAAATDVLGDWQLSAAGLLERDRFVVDLARSDRKVPLVVLMAGGYGAAAWRYTARMCGWLAAGEAVEPPDEADMIMRRFRAISAGWDHASEPDREDHDWGLSAEDLVGTIVPHDARFVGRFSRHEVELQLEQLGMLERIRRHGLHGLEVTLSPSPPLGQVLRVTAEPNRAIPLLELKAGRSRALLPDAEVIAVEWLLLQNPRATFTPRRLQLPGQEYPGLGMLRDVVAWLALICERVGLDGITFAPGQYYMAALGNRVLRFVEPVSQARFESMREALRGLRLADANRAVNEKRVVDAAGQPVPWAPDMMVLPVSRKLRRRLGSDEYRAEVNAARERMRFTLR